MTRLSDKRGLLGTGTTRNEQLHRELDSWGRNIMMAHVDRVRNGIAVFVMAKLLTHSSASWSPTLTQISQRRLLVRIAGHIRVSNFFPFTSQGLQSTSTRGKGDLQTPRVRYNVQSAAVREKKRQTEKKQWEKDSTRRHPNRVNNTNIFKLRRLDTRVRSNRNKGTI